MYKIVIFFPSWKGLCTSPHPFFEPKLGSLRKQLTDSEVAVWEKISLHISLDTAELWQSTYAFDGCGDLELELISHLRKRDIWRLLMIARQYKEHKQLANMHLYYLVGVRFHRSYIGKTMNTEEEGHIEVIIKASRQLGWGNTTWKGLWWKFQWREWRGGF